MHPNVLRSRALRLKWHVAAMRFEIAMRRHWNVLRKAGFNPSQSRDQYGRWTSTGDANETHVVIELSAQRRKPDGHHYVPRAVFEKKPFSGEALKEFEQAKTGQLNAGVHGWSKAHSAYNEAVK
jgi:hypothetical protein